MPRLQGGCFPALFQTFFAVLPDRLQNPEAGLPLGVSFPQEQVPFAQVPEHVESGAQST